jgi:hypothetical protein
MSGKASKGQSFDDQGPLPPGWKTRIDPVKNRRCYYNRSTKQTQWNRPKVPGEEPAKPKPAVDEGVPPGPSSAGSLVLQKGTSKRAADAAAAAETSGLQRVQSQGAPLMPTASSPAQPPAPAAAAPAPAAAAPEAEAPLLAPVVAAPPAVDQAGNALPAGWEPMVSQSSGDTYYKNVFTGDTTWDIPTQPAPGFPAESPAESPAEAPVAAPAEAPVDASGVAALETPAPAQEQEPLLQTQSQPEPEPEPEPDGADAADADLGLEPQADDKPAAAEEVIVDMTEEQIVAELEALNGLASPLRGSKDTDKFLEDTCSCIPEPLRKCVSAVWTSCIWMVLRTLWDIVPWLLPFGFFMDSLSLTVDSDQRGQLVVLLLFLATPMISMRYHGNSETSRNTLGDGWNIIFVAGGTLLTVTFVQVFLFILYDDIDSFLDLSLDSSDVTRVINQTSLSDPLKFSSAIFTGELLPAQFSDILDTYSFGKIFLAAPPILVVVLVLFMNSCKRCGKRARIVANDALSSELYSVGYFLWFYSAWLMLMHTKSDENYFKTKTTDQLTEQVQSIDSVETVSYMVNICAMVFMAFSIAVQEASDPTKADDMSKPLSSKSFSSGLGFEGMFWLICMWLNGTIALVTTFSWTYQRQDASVWPYFVGLAVGLMYIVAYWYQVVWWYSLLTDKHQQVSKSLAKKDTTLNLEGKKGCFDTCGGCFEPESDGFTAKQAFVEVVELLSQAGRAWLLLVVAMGSRFGFTPSVENQIFIGAFMLVIIAHFVVSMLTTTGYSGKKYSPYDTIKLDLCFDELYIVFGLVATVFLWDDTRGLPLCAAFSSDWAHVVTTFVPLLLSLWSLPTTITRTAIFMNNKRPSKVVLDLLFDQIDTDKNKSLDRKEIAELCANMGVEMDDEIEGTIQKMDQDSDGKITSDEFQHWFMVHSKKKENMKLARAMRQFQAGGLKKNAAAPPLQGAGLWTYITFAVIAFIAMAAVCVYGIILDWDENRLPFHSSMDQGMVHTTNATFDSTFEDYEAVGIDPDTTASFIVLDKYTALRFEEVDLPAGATVLSAVISFAPYVPGDENNPSQSDYCLDTNDLDAANYPEGVPATAVSRTDDSIALPAGADLQGVVAGQKMRLVDAPGETCGAAPKDTELVVRSVTGSTVFFENEIELEVAGTAAEKCLLTRPVCTSPMQINQGNLRVKAQTTLVSTTVDPPPIPSSDEMVAVNVITVPFVGAQNFAISGLEGAIMEVVDAPGWAPGNPMQFYLELLPTLSAADGAPVQAQSAACLAAEPAGTSCFFPKQLLAASCDSPQLTITYGGGGVTEEVTAVVWPKSPRMF